METFTLKKDFLLRDLSELSDLGETKPVLIKAGEYEVEFLNFNNFGGGGQQKVRQIKYKGVLLGDYWFCKSNREVK